MSHSSFLSSYIYISMQHGVLRHTYIYTCTQPMRDGGNATLFLIGWAHTKHDFCIKFETSNGSWCMGIKGEMSGTVCVTFTWYMYIYELFIAFGFFCCLFIIKTTQFVALYKPCKPKPKPSTYEPPYNHPLAEIQRPILRPEPKQQICHQHANTDHFGK